MGAPGGERAGLAHASNVVFGKAMILPSHYKWARAKVVSGWRNRALSMKVISFGLVGVVNTAVDYSVFLIARSALSRSATILSARNAMADFCYCGNPGTVLLTTANITSWPQSRLLCHEFVNHFRRRVETKAALARLRQLRRVERCWIDRQHVDLNRRRASAAAANLASERCRHFGKLRCEFFAFAPCGLSCARARQLMPENSRPPRSPTEFGAANLGNRHLLAAR